MLIVSLVGDFRILSENADATVKNQKRRTAWPEGLALIVWPFGI